jgi:hypothetical protein
MHLSKLWRRTRFADLIDRYLIFALILIAAIVCAFAALAQHWTGWLLVLLAPLAALGLWDLFQQQHTLMRNYPVIAHLSPMVPPTRRRTARTRATTSRGEKGLTM